MTAREILGRDATAKAPRRPILRDVLRRDR